MTAKERYEEYLKSQHWEDFKKSKSRVDNKRCLACHSGKEVQLHHMKYRPNLEDAELEDTCWLCRTCHESFHRIAGMTLKDVTDRMLMVETVRVILLAPKSQQSNTPKNPKKKKMSKQSRQQWKAFNGKQKNKKHKMQSALNSKPIEGVVVVNPSNVRLLP
jgi:hypothetical protein